jgi:hypothetical protein
LQVSTHGWRLRAANARVKFFSITTTTSDTILTTVNGEDFHMLTVMSVYDQSRSFVIHEEGKGKLSTGDRLDEIRRRGSN